MPKEYRIRFHPEAEKEFNNLDGRQWNLVKSQIDKLKTSPQIGAFLGNKTNLNLSGYRKLYADKKKIRIVYQIDEDIIEVYIIAVGARDDMEVYKKAADRK